MRRLYFSVELTHLALLGIFLEAAARVNRKRLALTNFLLVAAFAYLGLYSARSMALFSLITPIVLTRSTAPLAEAWVKLFPKRATTPKPLFHRIQIYLTLTVLTLAGMACVVQMLPEQANLIELEKAGMIAPTGALEYLEMEQPTGRLFNSYNWGGYLQWTLPKYALNVTAALIFSKMRSSASGFKLPWCKKAGKKSWIIGKFISC